ncbi:MAG: hypothetical protein C0518_14995 [Opitutus sp.]|nr:hypothetical protein [Opitutus sp.]
MTAMTSRRVLLRNVALLSLLMFAPFAQADHPLWVLIDPASGDSVFSTDAEEKKRLVAGHWKVNAEVRIWSEGAADRSELHRLVRVANDRSSRLVSARADEIATAKRAGFVDEGALGFVALKELNDSLVPVRRFKNGDRFLWLIDEADRAWAENSGWQLVGEDFWVMPAGK